MPFSTQTSRHLRIQCLEAMPVICSPAYNLLTYPRPAQPAIKASPTVAEAGATRVLLRLDSQMAW